MATQMAQQLLPTHGHLYLPAAQRQQHIRVRMLQDYPTHALKQSLFLSHSAMPVSALRSDRKSQHASCAKSPSTSLCHLPGHLSQTSTLTQLTISPISYTPIATSSTAHVFCNIVSAQHHHLLLSAIQRQSPTATTSSSSTTRSGTAAVGNPSPFNLSTALFTSAHLPLSTFPKSGTCPQYMLPECPTYP